MAKSNRKKYNKLVRDKIPTILMQSDQLFKAKIIKKYDLVKALSAKLSEECKEVQEALDNYIIDDQQAPYTGTVNKTHLLEEMADLMEVYLAIIKAAKLNPATLKAKMKEKKHDRGGFDLGVYLEWVEE